MGETGLKSWTLNLADKNKEPENTPQNPASYDPTNGEASSSLILFRQVQLQLEEFLVAE
jgi:hypothetical protein